VGDNTCKGASRIGKIQFEGSEIRERTSNQKEGQREDQGGFEEKKKGSPRGELGREGKRHGVGPLNTSISPQKSHNSEEGGERNNRVGNDWGGYIQWRPPEESEKSKNLNQVRGDGNR